MGVFDRVVLTLYTISLTVISLVIVTMAFGWLGPLDFIQRSLMAVNGRVVIGLVGTAFFVVSVRFMYFAFHRRSRSQTLIHQNPLGEVRISLSAIENLIKRIGLQTGGVKDLKAYASTGSGGVNVSLRVWVSPDASIPELSDHLQSQINKYVKSVVGVDVAEVRIHVENITTEIRSRRVE